MKKMNVLGMNARELITTIRYAALIKRVALATPFAPGTPGWKTMKVKGDDGVEIEVIALKDGNPIWVDSNGAESTLGGDTITRLNGEAASHRKDKDAALASLKAFEGLDPAKAREAVELASKIDKKQLLDAGKVDELTAQITAQFTEKLAASDKTNGDLRSRLNQTNLKNAFATSDFVKDKLALPMDVAQSYFSANIEYDDNGNMTFKYADGNPVMSKAKIGEKADFNEALSLLVDGNPNRDALLRGANHQGSNNQGGGGGAKPGTKTYRRSEMDTLSTSNPSAAAAAMAEVNAGTAQLVE